MQRQSRLPLQLFHMQPMIIFAAFAPVSWFYGNFIIPLVAADNAAYDDHEQG